MRRTDIKREVDFQIITGWVEDGSRVLDLGCGRGILLEHLKRSKGVYGVGVDTDPEKILGCVKRGVTAYQGEVQAILKEYPDGFFDWVVCSRTVQELSNPEAVIFEALRVGKRLAVSFANHGFWLNRWNMIISGSRTLNEVYPQPWHSSEPSLPISICDFENFCASQKIVINRHVYLAGDWSTPCRLWPNLRAGYVLYDLSGKQSPET